MRLHKVMVRRGRVQKIKICENIEFAIYTKIVEDSFIFYSSRLLSTRDVIIVNLFKNKVQ